MNKTDKRAVLRIGLGGFLGIAVMIPVGGLFNDLVSGGLISMGFHTPFRLISSQLVWLVGSQPLALVIQLLLYFAMGAVAALATLPFADDGKSLLLRSLAHFMVTAGLLSLTTWLLAWAWGWQALAVYLVLLAAVYLLIWLARWVGWYAEVADLRSRLGLAPGPSPLKWKESLPYLAFALGLCVLLPVVLRLLDPPDVPVLTGLLLPYLLYPVGGLFSGLSLGRRAGVCLLYPVEGGLLCLTTVLLLYNYTALPHCLLFVLPALAGNLAGAALSRKRPCPGKEETL